MPIVVWGLGHHARKNIIPAIRAAPGLQLYGVCSRNTAVVASVSDEHGCRAWTDPEEMLRCPDVEVVYLSTPIGLHAVHGEATLTAGKHLWCEKPLAADARQAMSLIGRSRERRLTLAEGFMYLYHPQFAVLEEEIRSGRLGRILGISGRFGIPPLEHPGFRNDPSLGGGAFLDVGCYPISAVLALLPTEDPSISFAEIVTPPGAAVDSEGRALLRYAGGTTAVLEWRTGAAYRNELDVWGTDGSLSTERAFSKPVDHVPEFRFLDVRGRAQLETGQAANHFVRMLAAFRNLADDDAGAERERLQIARRATLGAAIRDHSQKG